MVTDSSSRPVWFALTALASAAVLIVLVVNQVADLDGTGRTVARGLALLGAVVAAGVTYQRWSTVPQRFVPHHVMAGLGLLGGALVASSVVSAKTGAFASTVTATLGTVALLVATIAAATTVFTTSQRLPKEHR